MARFIYLKRKKALSGMNFIPLDYKDYTVLKGLQGVWRKHITKTHSTARAETRSSSKQHGKETPHATYSILILIY